MCSAPLSIWSGILSGLHLHRFLCVLSQPLWLLMCFFPAVSIRVLLCGQPPSLASTPFPPSLLYWFTPWKRCSICTPFSSTMIYPVEGEQYICPLLSHSDPPCGRGAVYVPPSLPHWFIPWKGCSIYVPFSSIVIHSMGGVQYICPFRAEHSAGSFSTAWSVVCVFMLSTIYFK